ncbi:MAG: S1 RNA-binding domain-containing protein [Thermodesulfobacteriota bacterium]
MTEEMEREEQSFAELLAISDKTGARKLSPGEVVAGVVIKISKDVVFIDLGGKSEGFADLAEFKDEEGKINIKEGDKVELRVASLKGGIYLSKGLKVHGVQAWELLRDAQQNQIPVEGRVAALIKGGFEVEMAGLRAFCPLSQIDLKYCEKPEEHIGGRYKFRILEMKGKKNILVSRRSLLQEEQEKKAQEIISCLQPDMELEGKIIKLTNFGAFVDLGGVQGMVHLSEITHARIKDPAEVLALGQVVKVKVLNLEKDKSGQLKISLSLKALEPEIWEKGLNFKEGDIISGKVSRLTDFGAFVELAPGLEGLVHISEISYQKVPHANRLLKEGEKVDVLVLKIDEDKRRISLSIRDVAFRDHTQGKEEARLEIGQVLTGIIEEAKRYGLFIRLPQLGREVKGFLPWEEILDSERTDLKRKFSSGREVQVEIKEIDDQGKILLSQKSLQEKAAREEYQKFLSQDKPGSLGTLGDIFKKIKS